jgi:hypothetical protein
VFAAVPTVSFVCHSLTKEMDVVVVRVAHEDVVEEDQEQP